MKFTRLLSHTFLLVFSQFLLSPLAAQTPAATSQDSAANTTTSTPGSDAIPEAAKKPPSNPLSLSAEALAAKAHLESLLTRRYNQELTTLIQSDNFTLNTQLDLSEIERKAPPPSTDLNDEVPMDLWVGNLSPEILLKGVDDLETLEKVKTFLSSYRIRKATFSLGFYQDVSDPEKTRVELSLRQKVADEFGNVGNLQIGVIQRPQKTFLDTINSFQGLLGHLLLALGLIIGAFLWASAQSKSTAAAQVQASPPAEAPANPQSALAAAPLNSETVSSVSEDTRLAQEVQLYAERLRALSPSIKDNLKAIVRTWCEGGSESHLKLACFAEAIGESLGTLPIPVDSIRDIKEAFSKMPDLSRKQKRDSLVKAYWDAVTAINLGAESLEEPFSYLGVADADMVSKALIEENEKLKTLVSIHMPKSLRQSYLDSLDSDHKKTLLFEAANLGAMDEAEFKSFDNSFKARLAGGADRGNEVTFDSAFEKLAETLSLSDQIRLLPEIEGAGIESFKRKTPTLAFLNQWPDDKLTALFAGAMPNELICYLRLRPEHQERFLGLCPAMTSAVVQDELTRENKMSDEDQSTALQALLGRVGELIQSGNVNLKTLYQVREDENKQEAA